MASRKITGHRSGRVALLVVFSQQAQARSTFIHFFLVIAALWLGMTATVREIVRERRLYARDRLAECLEPGAYLGGKLLFALAACLVQSLLLCLTARAAVAMFLGDADHVLVRQDLLEATSWLLGVAVCFLAAAGGALIGLTLSTLARTEQVAVACLPLVLLPQVLLSRVAYGDGGEGWSKPSPFAAIADVPSYLAGKDGGPAAKVLTAVSLPLLSRPAAAVLDMPAHDLGGRVLASESLYLGIVLLLHGLGLALAFCRAEPAWLQSR